LGAARVETTTAAASFVAMAAAVLLFVRGRGPSQKPQARPAGQDDITPLCLEPRLDEDARRNQRRDERARDQLATLADLLVA